MNPPKPEATAERGVPRKVVYVPACVTRIMGPAKGDSETGEPSLCPPASVRLALHVAAALTMWCPKTLPSWGCLCKSHPLSMRPRSLPF